jgi:hypothetical protein
MLAGMARPIEPTPTLEGEDAERLLESLEHTASPEEIARRRERARAFVAEVTRPKGLRPALPPAQDPTRR